MMMRPNPSSKEHPRPSSRWLILLGALLVLAFALFWKLRSRDSGGPSTEKDSPREGLSTYKSRAAKAPRAGERSSGAAVERPVISGNVYSMATGEPLAGAAVVATTFQIAGNIMSPVGSTKSDERGRFKIALPEGTYELNASMDGYGPGQVTARSGDTVSLMLPESGVIEGHVRDERGAPVSRFSIDVIVVAPGEAPASPPSWSRRFESPDGSFRVDQIPIWEVVVRATADGYAPAFSEMLSVGPKAKGNVDLVLTRGCSLSGTVKDKSGARLPKVFVDAESQIAAGELTNIAMHAAAQGQSDDQGAFQLSNVPKGVVIVRGYDGSNAVTTATIQVSDCAKLAPLDLVMSPGGGITGVAREGDGSPLVGARLSLMSRALGYVNVVSDKEGRFTFEDIPAGPSRIELSYQGRSMLSYVKVEEGKVTEQDITLFGAGKGELRGRITAGGRPLAGAKLMIASTQRSRGDIGLYSPVTDQDGNYRVPALPPGAYLITVNTVPRGKPAQIKAEETVTVDLDVTPKPPKPAPARKAAPEERN